jgi:hypothetical protein
MGAFGPDGLSAAGPASANPLLIGDHTTIDSLSSLKPTFDFIWHGESLLHLLQSADSDFF